MICHSKNTISFPPAASRHGITERLDNSEAAECNNAEKIIASAV